MKLLRTYIPDFRCLKNVEIAFEQHLKPQVFPIGGENGSGKSTLLQLIFVLLGCSLVPERHQFLKNLIRHKKRNDEKWKSAHYDIAVIELLYQQEPITLEFFVEPLIDNPNSQIDKFTSDIGEAILEIRKLEIKNRKWHEASDKSSRIPEPGPSLDEKLNEAKKDLEDYLEDTSILFLCDTKLPVKNKSRDYGLFCSYSHNDHKLVKEALQYASQHVYLAGQSTQPYIFLSYVVVQELLKAQGSYISGLEETRKLLPNFYDFDHFAVSEVLDAFKIAREKDWELKLETGQYGNTYDTLIDNFRTLLGGGKYIQPTTKLDSITVQRETNGTTIQLSPGDLSHGELKRASLYSWIKYKNINNSIVLIDEIENGLHPDWQYGIVRDLDSWNDNQYLLATHSFYLCEALTPRHVKEIEPKLKNPLADRK